MIGNFFTKQLMKHQLKKLPQDQQERIMMMFEKDPELLKKIGEEINTRVKKGGESQTKASIAVMKKYQKELQELMTP